MTAPDATAAPVETVSVTVDGIQVDVPKNALIIRAAEMVGIQVPRFCDHPLLDPIGACRQCIVEVEGQRKPVASCTVPVTDGMVIKTQLSSPVAEKAQTGNLEFLLLNHPLDCPVCDKGGECPLQNQTLSNGSPESRFRDVKRTYEKPIAISSQVLLDRERCVLCARCTRFSQQIAGDPFIELFERGALEQVAIYEDEPFSSYFSGNTVQICPVGALTGAQYRFRARPFDLVSTPSVCEHCASGCQQRTDWRRGKVMRRLAGNDPEVNEEWNCDKGRWAFHYATAKTRIASPLTRDADGYQVAASWTEATTAAAAALTTWKGKVGVLTGGRLTVEDAYAYSKFARIVLGTDDIDFRAREHSAEERDFLATQVAGHYLETTYEDLQSAPSVLLVGLEPEEESPILLLRLRKAAAKHGTEISSIAPFATKALAKVSGRLLSTVPGNEPAVLDALAAAGKDLDDAASAAAEGLRKSGSVILVGERLGAVPGGLTSAVALAKATGAKLAWVPRRAGDRGAVDAGCLPGLLPGGRPLTNAAAREELGAAWPGLLPTEAGRDTTAILEAAAAGELALVVAGIDPEDLPDPALALRALENAPFILSFEINASAVTERADIVFPVAPVVEKAGSFLDWEGRVRIFDATLEATGAVADRRALHQLAGVMGVDLGLHDTIDAQREISQLGAYSATRPEATTVKPANVASPTKGSAILASWHQLLDDGKLLTNEPFLAGTARTSVARLSATTAKEIGVAEGGSVALSTEAGTITLPLAITEMPDAVVWVPTFSAGSHIHSALGVGAGAVVSIAAAEEVSA